MTSLMRARTLALLLFGAISFSFFSSRPCSAQWPTLPNYILRLKTLLVFSGVDAQEMSRWVDSVYQSLDQRARVGQLIMPIIYPKPEDTEALLGRLKQERWGGILFQKGLLADQRRLTIRLQQASQIPLLIALDGEWGLNMRLKDAPRYPRNLALSRKKNPMIILQYAYEIARQCRLMGIHINFAPVLDVNSNPKNPVIGSRSFGSSVRVVSELGRMYSIGLETNGVLSVAKHFPGHGDTSEDSHKTLPTVSATKERMQEMELAPFRYYIENNLGGIMTAHLRVPAYDASGRPASLSPLITTELLRKEMDFDGLIFTDALEMKGAQAGGVPSVAVAALQAGNDILLGPSHPTKALDEIMAALKSGALTEASIEEKCRRVLAFKYALIIAKEDLGVAPEKVKDAIFTKEEAKLRAYLEESAGAKNVAADPTAKTPAMKSQSGRRKSTKR